MSDTNQSNGDLFARTIIENFSGTTVPKKALFDHLAQGGDLDSFVAQHPEVRRERAEVVLYAAETKRKELAKSGKPPENRYSAYLESLNEPEDEQWLLDVQAMMEVGNDKQAQERVMKDRNWSFWTGSSMRELFAEVEAEMAARQAESP